MIFVTVGTHEQQFNRLVECVDELKKEDFITEDVFIQTGFSTYEPRYCDYKTLLPYSEMQRYVNDAKIVITHGGPSSFIMPLQIGKIPIVVPRQQRYGEHVNDHQVDFCREVRKRFNNILLAETMERLKYFVKNYDELTEKIEIGSGSSNSRFCKKLQEIVSEMFE